MYGVDAAAGGDRLLRAAAPDHRRQGEGSLLAQGIGRDLKGKVSLLLYLVAIAAAFLAPWLAGALYALVALIWLIPDRRIERVFATREKS